MQIKLSAEGENLLRVALARHPGESPAEILEAALAERVQREASEGRARPKRTREGFQAWLNQFAIYSDRIPSLPGETFSREMIYEDHA